MQFQILNGIYTDGGANLRTSYPVNLMPVPKKSGASNGYLRPAYGIQKVGEGLGIDRGGIVWNGAQYRVSGSKLITVDASGVVAELGDVGNDELPVRFDYSFDRLAIASAGSLFYWNGSLTKVTDPDLGVVRDMLWVAGYFMTTDGFNLVVTELDDPTQVNPLKYGSSESDPDQIMAVLKLRNEVYAVNRNTIEVFDNVGGTLFPFQRVTGAQMPKGAVGARACCVYMDAIAFLGGARNESPSVYLGLNSSAQKISTQEIDDLLQSNYTDYQLSRAVMEVVNDKSHQHLYVHLPDMTIVYDAAASQQLGEPVWFTLTSSVSGFSQYRAKFFTWFDSKWFCGDTKTNAIGYQVEESSHHWGEQVRWEFGTQIVYNEGKGALFHQLELVSLTGRIALGKKPIISTSYSADGLKWSQQIPIRAGTTGDTTKRLVWLQQGHMRNIRIQRFMGDSDAHLSFARLEVQLEGMAY